jgi:hypothetical protein
MPENINPHVERNAKRYIVQHAQTWRDVRELPGGQGTVTTGRGCYEVGLG